MTEGGGELKKGQAGEASGRLLPLPEVASAAGVSPSTVRNWARKGLVKKYPGERRRAGRAPVLYSLDEVLGVKEGLLAGGPVPAPKAPGRARRGRAVSLSRETLETRVEVELRLDGAGEARVETGVPFLDHLLAQLARHSGFDLRVRARGDLSLGVHHVVEDTALALGEALAAALEEREGMRRFGHALVPMDEALVEVALDLSGRPYALFRGEIPWADLGGFEPGLLEHFLRSLASASRSTLHVRVVEPGLPHHLAEACFKALGRALSEAVEGFRVKVPSTKGRVRVRRR